MTIMNSQSKASQKRFLIPITIFVIVSFFAIERQYFIPFFGSLLLLIGAVGANFWKEGQLSKDKPVKTFFYGVILFTLTISGLVELSSGDHLKFTTPFKIEQNISSYFEAIGGISVGLAGALAAILIAHVATTLQKKTTEKELKKQLEEEIKHLSYLNAKLIRATLNAKRACAAYLTSYAAYLTSDKEAKPSSFNSIFGGKVKNDKDKKKSSNFNISQDKNSHNFLIEEFKGFINALEELVMDSTYKSVFKSAKEKINNEQMNTIDEVLINDIKINRLKKIDLKGIIVDSNAYWDFIKHHQTYLKNFGNGLPELIGDSFFENYSDDFTNLIKFVQDDKITPSQAAWLLLGMLTLIESNEPNGAFSHKTDRANLGIKYIALMLGSLINPEILKKHFSKNGTRQDLEECMETSKLDRYIEELEENTIVHLEIEQNPEQTQGQTILDELNDILEKDYAQKLLAIIGTSNNHSPEEPVAPNVKPIEKERIEKEPTFTNKTTTIRE